MKIKTLQFGEIEFDEDRIIKLPEGIFGFEELSDYLFIKTDDELFYWLTSIDKPDIVFPLVALKMIDSEYAEKENSEAFGIVKLDKDPAKITVNMRAPVYINQDKKEGSQVILDEEKYTVSYKLFTEEPDTQC